MEEWRGFAPGYTVSNKGNMRGPNGPLKPRKCGVYWGMNRWLSDAKKRKNHKIHRLVALAFVHNPRPDIFDVVDHIDQNKSNNHHTNLRWVNTQLNLLNNSGRSILKTSSGKWMVRICVNYKKCNFGTYATEAEALKVARRWKAKIFHGIYVSLVGPHTDVTPAHSNCCGAVATTPRQPRDSSAQLLRAWLSQSGESRQPREDDC
jgi:hypothetical protein